MKTRAKGGFVVELNQSRRHIDVGIRAFCIKGANEKSPWAGLSHTAHYDCGIPHWFPFNLAALSLSTSTM